MYNNNGESFTIVIKFLSLFFIAASIRTFNLMICMYLTSRSGLIYKVRVM